MRRIITVIIIILIVVAVVLTGAWLLSRRTATQNGTQTQSFRDFLTGKSGTGSSSTTPGDLSSSFTPGETPTTGETPSSTGGSTAPTQTRTSTFTNSNLSPSTSTLGGSLTPPGSAVGSGGQLPNTTGTNGGDLSPGGGVPSSGGTATTLAPECSDADLNITFTPNELNQLKALQNRFYAIADTLYTDANVSTEISNRDSFAVKARQINDLYQYCEAHQVAVAATNPSFKYRVPTPFWYEPNNPNYPGGSIAPPNNSYTGYVMGKTTQITGLVPGQTGINFAKQALENALRLNLW